MQNFNIIPGPHISVKITKLLNCLHFLNILLPFHSSPTHKYIIRGKWYILGQFKLFWEGGGSGAGNFGKMWSAHGQHQIQYRA